MRASRARISPSGRRMPAGVGGGRFQRLGRPPPPDAAARRDRRVGDLHARPGRRRAYKYEIRGRAGGAAAEGRSGGLRVGTSARNASVVRTISGRLAGRRLDGSRAARQSHRRADLGLRGASGVMAARAGQPDAQLSRNWPSNWSTMPPTWASPISSFLPVSPNFPSTGPGAISRWACSPPRSATAPRRIPRLCRCGAPQGAGRAARLGAGPFPDRRARAGPVRRHALYEHADPREGFHQDWNTLIYNYGRVEVKNYLSPTRCTGWRNTTSTGCAWMRWPRCSTATIRARTASGCRTRRRARELRGDRRSAAADEHHGLRRRCRGS
jgi:hypothetical protein